MNILRKLIIWRSGSPRLRLVKFLNDSIKKIYIWSSGGPKLRLVKFLNDSIKKIKHFEFWKSHVQFLCTFMHWVCKIIQSFARVFAIIYDYV